MWVASGVYISTRIRDQSRRWTQLVLIVALPWWTKCAMSHALVTTGQLGAGQFQWTGSHRRTRKGGAGRWLKCLSNRCLIRVMNHLMIHQMIPRTIPRCLHQDTTLNPITSIQLTTSLGSRAPQRAAGSFSDLGAGFGDVYNRKPLPSRRRSLVRR